MQMHTGNIYLQFFSKIYQLISFLSVGLSAAELLADLPTR